MPNVKVFNMQGAEVGQIDLADEVFAVDVHVSAMHTMVRAILNAKRQGTQSAKTRTEVRGGGRKIYRQKGTGNARHHGRRAPQFTHGGVVFAPKPRSYRINVPKAIRRLAMKSALTCKVNDSEIVVLDKIELQEAKTKFVAQMLKALGSEKKALIVTKDPEAMVVRAANNIPGVKVAHVGCLNVVDILNCDKFIIAQDAVKQVEEVYAQ
ncbi:MAG TPA: 50S ribosomal protein L4 [Candidatus Pullichristensenella excrementigallinarum]|uniref:Large ribosomal subunit protein uL4 n=1 Tax=Candidatus Pullichristensenella excrementigallinarum TaxID=2840907 RepID=A0A9D1I9W1_9FIRM|nr:50S ribosomal protein L4 [Candidatus Pullichristensenella excrementigallinarum]